MLAGRPHIEPKAAAHADSVVVTEIYLSLQGESSHVGRLCTFIRLTGCHLRCRYCDSAFAFYGGERMTVERVVDRVKTLSSRLVEITGGEPLLQPAVYPLMARLLAEDFEVLLETSGAIDIRLVPHQVKKIVDLKTPSSGECDRNDYRVLDRMQSHDELKFVIGDRGDYVWARQSLLEHHVFNRGFAVLFSPTHGQLPPRELASWIAEDKLPVRFQLQMHKYVWEPDARGV